MQINQLSSCLLLLMCYVEVLSRAKLKVVGSIYHDLEKIC